MLTNEEIQRRWDALDAEFKSAFEKSGMKFGELAARMMEVEQKLARRPGGGGEPYEKTWGSTVIEDAAFKALAHAQRGRANISVKATITTAAGSGGALAPPDRLTTPQMLAQRRIRIRDLIAPGRTTSTAIEYPRQTGRTTAAAMVSEGVAKPESSYTFETVTVPVRTLAHWVPASKQIFDDAPMLASIIDNELRYGLADVEEDELLNGAGTGQHLNGIKTQATAFSAPFSVVSQTMIDTLLLAIAQVEEANYEPDGIILNPLDWARILSLKDGEDRYLAGGPFSAQQVERLWTLPVVKTQAMTEDDFLVGAFRRGAQIFDREDANVEISTEHDDYFVRNLVAIRAEERLALAVYRPTAFVTGDFGNVTG